MPRIQLTTIKKKRKNNYDDYMDKRAKNRMLPYQELNLKHYLNK
jgi:hypothetical protein